MLSLEVLSDQIDVAWEQVSSWDECVVRARSQGCPEGEAVARSRYEESCNLVKQLEDRFYGSSVQSRRDAIAALARVGVELKDLKGEDDLLVSLRRIVFSVKLWLENELQA